MKPFGFQSLIVLLMMPLLAFSAELTSVTLSPDNQDAGETTYHTAAFTTVNPIPADGLIVLRYGQNSGFDLSSVNVATITTPAAMDGSLQIAVDGDSVTLTRTGGTATAGGAAIEIELYHIKNTESAGDYSVIVNTKDNASALIDGNQSADFTINALAHDAFVFDTIADVNAGDTFSFDMTAVDRFGNTITGFDNQTVTLTLDWTRDSSTLISDLFSNGVVTQSIDLDTAATFVISADDGNGHTGTSNSFDVASGAVDAFDVSNSAGPQTAGTEFFVVMTARDEFGNVAAGFNGTVTLNWGTDSKESAAFSAGRRTESVTITTTGNNLSIAVNDGSGHTGMSDNAFDVNPAALDAFVIDPIPDGNAGNTFTFDMTAVDRFGNTYTNFDNDRVTMTIDWTRDSDVELSDLFNNGVVTQNVDLDTAATFVISVDDANGHTGTSNSFVVAPGAVDGFAVQDVDNSQTAGMGFSVVMTAKDEFGNVAEGFNDTVTMNWGSDSKESGNFYEGRRSESVTITTAGHNVSIAIEDDAGHTAVSNEFNVNPLELSGFNINPVSNGVAGGTFSIVMTAVDIYDNTITTFNETVDMTIQWEGDTNTITSGAFSNGARTQHLNLDDAGHYTVTVEHTNSGNTGASNRFVVAAGDIDHFEIEDIDDPQLAGTGFTVTITAYDQYDNVADGFTGPVDINWGSGSLTSGLFSEGRRSETITETRSANNVIVRVDDNNGHTQTSNSFDISSLSVSTFSLNHTATVEANEPFTLSLTARDIYDNLADDFTGTVTIDWGTGSQTTPAFIQGAHNENDMRITKSGRITLTADDGFSNTGQSQITVTPLGVDHFEIGHIESQDAGVAFDVNIEARDEFDNVAESYSGNGHSVNIDWGSDNEQSNDFSNGLLSQSIVINTAHEGVQLTVQDENNAAIQGQSNEFNVRAGGLASLEISHIYDQISNEPFSMTITAYDGQGNIATSFDGTVDITDLSGSIDKVSGQFDQGQVIEVVTVNTGISDNRITVVRTGGSERDVSNPFNVVAPPGIRVTSFEASRATATAGQADDLNLEMTLENLSGSAARLDSVRFKYYKTGILQTDYGDNENNLFEETGGNILNGNGSATLIVNISQIGMAAGDVDIQGDCYFWDPAIGKEALFVAPFTGIEVQTPAEISIQKIITQSTEYTVGQGNWTVDVIVQNSGGSTVDFSAMDLSLEFGLGEEGEWDVEVPDAFHGENLQLEGNQSDTLNFVIHQAASSETGACPVDVRIAGIVEENTGRVLDAVTAGSQKITIEIEEPPYLEIVEIENLAMNDPYININQALQYQVVIRNSGGDGVHNLELTIDSDQGGQRSTFDTDLAFSTLEGGETKTVIVQGLSSSLPVGPELLTFQFAGLPDNVVASPVYSAVFDDNLIVQTPIDLEVTSIVASEDTVTGGQVDAWTIEVTVRNMGDAEALLDRPLSDDLSFEIDGIPLSDYNIRPPAKLTGKNDLLLSGAEYGNLTYTVLGTGSLGGQLRCKAVVSGVDQNDGNGDADSLTVALIQVKADPKLRILSTKTLALHQTDAGNAYVNTGQTFPIQILIENGLGMTLNDVVVELESNGSSLPGAVRETIESIGPNSRDSLSISIEASSAVRTGGETFTARIVEALMITESQDVLNAPVGPAIDNTAIAYIQSPAVLSLTGRIIPANGQVSTDQDFTVEIEMLNSGLAAIDTTAKARITIPTNYRLDSATPQAVTSLSLDDPAAWTIRSPGTAQNRSSITVILDRIPNDLNSGQTADVLTGGDRVVLDVTTIQSYISAVMEVNAPLGATDNLVSTGQLFTVNADVYTQNADDVVATLTLPEGYTTSESTEKSVLANRVFWQVKAPAEPASGSMIVMNIVGKDALQPGVSVSSVPFTLEMNCIEKANLSMDLQVEDGSVSLGQSFEVKAHVNNIGIADTVGTAYITLSPLPDKYSTKDPLMKPVVNGYTSWTIEAPTEITREAVNVEATLTAVPEDENTNEQAFVSRLSDQVAITTVGTWLSVSHYTPADAESGLLVPGSNQSHLMSMTLINRGEAGANSVLIHSMKFAVYDLNGEPLIPGDLFEDINVVQQIVKPDTTYIDWNTVFGSASGNSLPKKGSPLNNQDTFENMSPAVSEDNPVTIYFSRNQAIEASDTLYLAVVAQMKETEESISFQIGIDEGTWIDARDQSASNIVISVLDAEGKSIEPIVSKPRQVVSSAFLEESEEPYLINCPNPFGSGGKENTTLIYYLEEADAVHFRLYSLLGSLVWEREFLAADPEGAAGLHSDDVFWNGQNSSGFDVLNGVYILIMETGSGHISKRKIAVVR